MQNQPNSTERVTTQQDLEHKEEGIEKISEKPAYSSNPKPKISTLTPLESGVRLTLLRKTALKRLLPSTARLGGKTFSSIDSEAQALFKSALSFAHQRALENGRTTIRAGDFSAGLKDHLESYGLAYLKLLKNKTSQEIEEFFSQKIAEVETNVNRRRNNSNNA